MQEKWKRRNEIRGNATRCGKSEERKEIKIS